MSDYYAEDCDRLPFATSVALYQRHVPRWFALYMAAWPRFRAFIGLPLKLDYATRWAPDFEWQSRDEMPARALSRWAAYLERLQDCGFEVCGWVKSDTIGAKEEANAFLLDEPGTTLATVLWLRMGAKTCIEQTQVSFTSFASDGGEIMTMALPKSQQLLTGAVAPDYVDLVTMKKSTPVEDVYRTHCERLELGAITALTQESLLTHYTQQRIRLFEHSRNTGLLRALTQREIDYAKTFSVAESHVVG